MPGNLKRNIQNFMTRRYRKEYEKALYEQSNVYDVYMQKQEADLQEVYANKACSLAIRILTKQEFVGLHRAGEEIFEDILIVTGEEGILNPVAKQAIGSYFEEHPEYSLLYADEDVCIGEKKDLELYKQKGVKISKRCCPDLKPIPSPETFLSYRYFGNIWAVRRELYKSISVPEDCEPDVYEYAFLLCAWKKVGNAGIVHLPEILFHKFAEICKHGNGKLFSKEEMERFLREADRYAGNEDIYNAVKDAYFREKGIVCTMHVKDGYSYPVYELNGENPLISILIPSKDNPEVLKKCISSIYVKSTYPNYEIIVVDNGSHEENKARIEAMRVKYPFTYLYNPMEFNYSAMNNMAAGKARGSILVLLNDDMEVVTPDWLERMSGQLLQEGIGAVGAKLLYPDSTLIQHVGITNAVDGPVHKLLKKDDKKSYNHGRNKLVYNVLGVTGACLMIRRSDYERLGGLKENLRVAYNDVDLCFSLFEAGLRNVIRNDVILYHHESLSRGADVMSAEKMQRLKAERDYLYSCHPDLYYKDPYEGANNVGGADFGIQIQPDYSASRSGKNSIVPCDRDYSVYPSGIHVGIDRAEKDAFIRVADKALYVVEGYAVLPESDNCRYVFKLILKGVEQSFCMPIEKKLRPNMAGGFPNARNVELCGFHCWFTEGELPGGEYRVGIYTADRCSRQKLYQDTGVSICVE